MIFKIMAKLRFDQSTLWNMEHMLMFIVNSLMITMEALLYIGHSWVGLITHSNANTFVSSSLCEYIFESTNVNATKMSYYKMVNFMPMQINKFTVVLHLSSKLHT